MLGPIFAREWLTVPRRANHYVIRSAYLGLLWVLGWTAWQATVGWSQLSTVADNARFGVLFFQLATLVQLILLPFLAAVSAASAVTSEKDRRTFVLLLITDLRSYEIVLGKLLGSLLQILLLLLGMIPILAMIMLLGGVAPIQVAQATLVLAATCVAAGTLGNLIALWRDKTFQALALTVLFLVLYLCVVQGLGVVPGLAWLQKWVGPFQALQSVLEPRLEAGQPVAPPYVFTIIMLLFTVLMSTWGMMRLRVWNPSGEPIQQRERPEDEQIDRSKAHAAPGAVRGVWANPILWREIRTRAYGRRPLLVKVAYFVVLALVCYYALSPVWTTPENRADFAAAQGLVPVGILSLLLVAAQAVTAITSERDTGALDLLLVTDLTPKEFIFGKLWGILYNTKEYLLPPLILAVAYALFGFLGTPPSRHPELLTYKNAEAFVCIAIATLVVLSFATVLGVHVGLRTENSRLAVLQTLATAFFLSVGTLICIYLILINGRFEVQWFSFSVFIFAGIGGLWWVLRADRPAAAINLASAMCPLAVFYTVTSVLVGKPGSTESADPLVPFVVTVGAFGFAIAAMLVPLLSEFDVALGRTSAAGE